MGTEYFITIPIKVRVSDLSRINEAANAEISEIVAKHPDDQALWRFTIPSPIIGLKWFLSATRLEYIFGGIETILELGDVISADRFPAQKTGNHHHDWWIDEAPEYLPGSAGPAAPVRIGGFSAGIVGEDENDDTYSLGIAENADGTGQSLIFSRLTGDPGPNDVYSIEAPMGTKSGGVLEYAIEEDRLRLTFTDEAADRLGADKHVTILLHAVNNEQRKLLKKGLRHILTYGSPDQIPRMN